MPGKHRYHVSRRQWREENPGTNHPLDTTRRLNELKNMGDGWLDGEGRAPDPAGLDWLIRQFENRYPEDLPLPYLYPTPGGGVEAEWGLDGGGVNLEVNLENRRGALVRSGTRGDGSGAMDLDLAKSAGWEELAAELRRPGEGKR